MKKLALPLVIVLLALTGCAHNYVLRLSNGHEITSVGKPKLKDGVYHYKDARGREHTIGQARVTEVEPASMAASERKPVKPISTGPTQPKKRHWYFLWLA